MKSTVLILFACAAIWAQDTPNTAEAGAKEHPAEKPSPQKKARELLDSAAGAVGSAQPDVQATGLMHLADNYQVFDKKKSAEYFQQAFNAAGALPEERNAYSRVLLQSDIVTML